MISQFFSVTFFAELFAFLGALFIYQKERGSIWGTFVFYLGFVLLIESVGFYSRVIKEPNHIWYNWLMLVQAIYFSVLFDRFLQWKQSRSIILGSLFIFLLIFIGEGIYRDFSWYHAFSRQFLSGMLIFFSCLFYYALLQDEDIANPLQHPPFWIVTGLMIFYFGTLTLFALYDRVSSIKISGNRSFYQIIIDTLSCLLYGSWMIAFICRKKLPVSYKPS